MGYYIYRYVHPDYPWLYVGQTIDIEKRIKSHDSNNGDNISRKYENLLKESRVLFFEVGGKNQMDYVESFLIDKYKPYLNKKDKFVDRECPVEMKLPTWQIYRDRDSSLESSTKDFLKILKKVEKAQEEIEAKKKAVSDLEKEIEVKNEQLKDAESKLNALTSIVPSALHPTEDLKDKKSIFVDVKFIKEFYKTYPNSDVTFTSINYSETGKANKCTIDKDKVVIATRNGSPQIYKRKDDDGISWSFTGDILINSYACFSRFKPSTSLVVDIMLSYYADQILKVKKELCVERPKVHIIPYKDIKQSGHYTVFNSIIPVEEIYKDRDREGAHHITDITIIQHEERLDWDNVGFVEWKEDEYNCNTSIYNKSFYNTSSEHPCYKEMENKYYRDLLKTIKEGDFFVLRDEDYEKCHDLESELCSLESKMKELSEYNEND